jgi:tetratricopeptide (TPR) repeat protein
MAKRPASHQLEEKSRLAFRSLLPIEWILRAQTPDYGLDEQVQIVESEVLTPLLFAVQLKATEKLAKKKTFPFSTERLRDYAALSLPVMIAVYDATNDAFHYTWSHHLHQSLDRATAASWLVQASIAIPLTKELDRHAAAAIVEEVGSYYARLRSDGQARPVPIAFNYEEESNFRYHELIAALGTVGYSVRRVARDQASLVLTLSPRSLTLQLNGEDTELPLEEAAHALPTGLALLVIAFAGVRRARLSLDCFHTLVTTGGALPEAVESALLTPLLPMAFGSEHRTSESQLLVETLLDAGYLDLGLSIISAFLYDDRHTAQHVLKAGRLLMQALALSTDKDQRATILYSLGNNHRSRGELRAALAYYFEAARESKGYLRKNYWWAEAAGCLFLLQKYRFAELFYRKALACPGQENAFNHVLLADALLHQGGYRQAERQLAHYLANSPPTAFAELLHQVSDALAKQWEDKKRDPMGAAAGYFHELEATLDDTPPERAEQALQRDPLFAPAYFARGVTSMRRGDNWQAAWDFLFAGFFNTADIEAWANACVLFMSLPDEKNSIRPGPAVFAYAYQLHGAALEAEFFKRMGGEVGNSIKSAKGAKELLDLARKCEAMYPRPSAAFFRVPDLQEPESKGGFWFSKDSVPDIL